MNAIEVVFGVIISLAIIVGFVYAGYYIITIYGQG